MKTIEQLQRELSQIQSEIDALKNKDRLRVAQLKDLNPGDKVKLVESSPCVYRVVDLKGFPKWCRFIEGKNIVYHYPETKEVLVVATRP